MSTDIMDNQEIKGFKLFRKGKVREVYEVPNKINGDDALLFVASDRISAFDVVLPTGIPDKGAVLTQTSKFWFDWFGDKVPNHLISSDVDEILSLVPGLEEYRDYLKGRTMLVKKTEPLAIECVVRGYLTGSGWKDYQKTQSVCGIKLPEGMQDSDKLPETIFTPATKATTGHDENIDEKRAREIVGDTIFDEAKEKSIWLYETAREYAHGRGIIICDTKFEFGIKDGKLILIDEVLTPDSSRFWRVDDYQPGKSQKSFDKQFVRDYLETVDWDKTPPGPELPEEITQNSREKYLQSYEFLTGKPLEIS